MPELPEVEHTRGLLARVAVGRTLDEVFVADDPIVVEDAPRFASLVGREVVGAHRHGKVAWLELQHGPHLVFHLGMTGAWRHPGSDPLALESTPSEIDRSWPPKFSKLVLRTSDGDRLAMTDPRRFGRLWLRDDPRREPPVAGLGFDAANELPDPAAFARSLARRRGSLKGLLLDQSFVAGIGNWIADEVLFHARLDPRRAPSTLERRETDALRDAIAHVISTAIAADARKERFPKDWLFHRRWGKVAGSTTEDGRPIEHLVVAGRTTAWVPSLQGGAAPRGRR